jgi:hypothetical protein
LQKKNAGAMPEIRRHGGAPGWSVRTLRHHAFGRDNAPILHLREDSAQADELVFNQEGTDLGQTNGLFFGAMASFRDSRVRLSRATTED